LEEETEVTPGVEYKTGNSFAAKKGHVPVTTEADANPS
jgi:hypothetical protein